MSHINTNKIQDDIAALRLFFEQNKDIRVSDKAVITYIWLKHDQELDVMELIGDPKLYLSLDRLRLLGFISVRIVKEDAVTKEIYSLNKDKLGL